MAIPLNVNGTTYEYPETDDLEWGPDATEWAAAVTVGMLQKAGGLFQLLAEVDFGTAYGLKTLYLTSRTATPAAAGVLRLAKTDVIAWKNNAGGGDLPLGVDSSDRLTFDGNPIIPSTPLAASRAVVTDASGVLDVALTTATEIGYVNGVTSAIQTQLDAKLAIAGHDALSVVGRSANSSGDVADIDAGTDGFVLRRSGTALGFGLLVNANIDTAAAIDFSKLAALTSAHILVGSAGGVATDVAMSGDVTIGATGITAIGANKVTLAQMAQIVTPSFLGRVSASTGNVEVLTVTQATAMLNVMTGDAGSGGLKGLVPAQATGDATKFLNGAGTWGTPAGAGDVVGPGSATDGGFAKFDGTTGKLLKSSAATIALNNGGTGQITKAAAFDALSPMSTGGDIIYGGTSGTGTRLTNGNAGNTFMSNGGTSAPSWQAPGKAYMNVYFPGSGSNYWSTTSSTYADFTAAGSIPAPTIRNSAGFSSIGGAASSRPGIAFTAPYTGIIRIQARMSAIYGDNSGAITSGWEMVETGGSTVIDVIGFQSGVVALSVNQEQLTLEGYLSVIASSSYNVVIKGKTSTSTIFLGAEATDTCLIFLAEYVT